VVFLFSLCENFLALDGCCQMLVGFEASRADLDTASSRKGSPLKVGIAKPHSCRIKLGGTDTVGVPSTVLNTFFTDWT
jgi:hypothetical protein